MSDLNRNEGAEHLNKRDSSGNSPIADLVSLETIVNVLIRKGLCTAEELLEEEQKRRRDFEETRDTAVVQTNRSESMGTNGARPPRNASWLKRTMVKRRWTRRLGTFLFGWEWKKVKVERSSPNG